MAIKKNIDLQNLRKSTLSKHNKIYDKATKMLTENYTTPELSHMELEILAERFKMYGLRVNVSISGDITVRSKCDNWVIVDEGFYYVLYHETTVGSRGKNRHSHHVQDIFYDLDFLMASIVTHDEFKMSMERPKISDIKALVGDVSIMDGDIEFMEFVY